MKASIIFTTIALLATQVLAAPTQASAHAETRRFQAQLIFIGSDPSQFYTLSVPTTSGSTFEVSKSSLSLKLQYLIMLVVLFTTYPI